jgi:hypothetical protein
MANAASGTPFFHLVAAVFIGFVLAALALKHLDKGREGFQDYERFPSPLVTPGPSLPVMVQGRDYIPHRLKPTLPPGPAQPLAVDSDGQLYETLPPNATPAPPLLTLSNPQATSPLFTLPPAGAPTKGPSMPYAMTNDTYLSFIAPENSGSVTPDRARLTAIVGSKLRPLTAAI